MDLDVLLPFHRIDNYFEQAIDSLANTKGISFNTILIDDRLDKSQEIYGFIRSLKNFEIIKTDGGTGYSNTLKIGTPYVTQDCVALFNSDDLMHPSRFQKQIQELSSTELCISKISRIKSNNSKSASISGEIKAIGYDPIYLLLGSYGANASWCMRTEWWKQNSFFDDEACLDWRIALKSFRNSSIAYIPEPLYFYRKHKSQITNNKIVSKEDLWSTYEMWNKFANDYNLQNFSFDIFSVFGVPWNTINDVDLNEVKIFLTAITKYIKDQKKNVVKDFDKLIKRRLIFAIRQDINFKDKLWLAKSGITEAVPILRDLFLGVM